MISANECLKSLWGVLSDRQQEVLAGRFGLEKFKRPMTLAALGNRYGITRERVRQIEAAALKLLGDAMKKNSHCVGVIERSRKFLKSVGGVASEEQLVAEQQSFVKDMTENHFALLLAASRALHFHPGDEEFRPFYYLDQKSLDRAKNFLAEWAKQLKKHKSDVLEGKYTSLLKSFVKEQKVSPREAQSFLSISKLIHENPYGDVGLADWPEIRPTTVRDRIYLVLKKSKQPLHFQTIATMITGAGLSDRPALAPTVHNELIKDPRFILVGRGMYGLSEDGYKPGNARDVIHRILKKQGAMRPREIILAVQKERFFKPNTVLVNLQNKQMFQRRTDGSYHVREA